MSIMGAYVITYSNFEYHCVAICKLTAVKKAYKRHKKLHTTTTWKRFKQKCKVIKLW